MYVIFASDGTSDVNEQFCKSFTNGLKKTSEKLKEQIHLQKPRQMNNIVDRLGFWVVVFFCVDFFA